MSKIFIYVAIVSCLLAARLAVAQESYFPDKCMGSWQGTMYIYKFGLLKDSIQVKLTVAKHTDKEAWSWKTEYLSAKQPVTKDYVLRLKDASKNLYITDEGGGVALTDYLVGQKLYSVFETGGYLLTASYELLDNKLIFEVTSGKKEPAIHPDINTYSSENLQRVVFEKLK
ncbi:MAG: hypothetical protein R2822_08070 [Spirosomataceae bacterium]